MSTVENKHAAQCRYCQRYRHACGRPHTVVTAADWARDWRGNPPVIAKAS